MGKYKLLRDSRIEPGAKAGTIVYDLRGSDYGCASEDTYVLGEECVSVTLNESGEYPFFTVPVKDLEPI